MIGEHRVLGLVTARGGSKGLPRKNVLPLAGQPLIAWTIAAARQSKYLDMLALSSDDDEIMRVAKEHGCEVPFRRPAHLAADETPGIAPVLHALDQLDGFDYVVLLQPTSPLRTTEDIDGAIERCIVEGAPACVSVMEAAKPPDWMFTLGEGSRLAPLLSERRVVTHRQDATEVYVLNGAVYVSGTYAIRKSRTFITDDTVGYVMPESRSVDIDSMTDLLLCSVILEGRGATC